ncbi:MAG TPA: hypothetical protein VGG44_04205, partial [Tepidisphaeraceae bacterium]
HVVFRVLGTKLRCLGKVLNGFRPFVIFKGLLTEQGEMIRMLANEKFLGKENGNGGPNDDQQENRQEGCVDPSCHEYALILRLLSRPDSKAWSEMDNLCMSYLDLKLQNSDNAALPNDARQTSTINAIA